MDTFWLIGHDKLPPPSQMALLGMEEIFESVYEPEFLQNIWERWTNFLYFSCAFVVGITIR